MQSYVYHTVEIDTLAKLKFLFCLLLQIARYDIYAINNRWKLFKEEKRIKRAKWKIAKKIIINKYLYVCTYKEQPGHNYHIIIETNE